MCTGTYMRKRCGKDSGRVFNIAIKGISRLNDRKLKSEKIRQVAIS